MMRPHHVAQSESMVQNAAISLGYTLMKAPVDGSEPEKTFH